MAVNIQGVQGPSTSVKALFLDNVWLFQVRPTQELEAMREKGSQASKYPE